MKSKAGVLSNLEDELQLIKEDSAAFSNLSTSFKEGFIEGIKRALTIVENTQELDVIEHIRTVLTECYPKSANWTDDDWYTYRIIKAVEDTLQEFAPDEDGEY